MRSFVLLLAVALSSCRPCPAMKCISFVDVGLGTTERAIFDEGETAVQLCIDATCLDFTVPAGSRAASASTETAQIDLVDNPTRLLFQVFDGLQNEGARNVKLVISREGTERVNRSWPATAFSFIDDQKDACAQSCVNASVTL